ncbi:probable transmembrane GTPase FZO-like, chloroplastic isoform X1 [Cicer arietinum]|uniref:probable transmembrane GTPase FZO-like, chloroplastic isoform X1 n=1 Tax=Cicer arietinum TaxID=3827 RepID=UPI00032A964A
MVPCSITTPSSFSSLVAAANAIIPRHVIFSRSSQLPLRPPSHSSSSLINSNASRHFYQKPFPQAQAQPRTLFPGGYKRPKLQVPTLILQLNPDDILTRDQSALDMIDKAVSKSVGIVVLSSNEQSGGKLYEAACMLKSLVRDRAYLLVAERVDIAAAAVTSGVLLSDQGLPTVVARNTMLGSNAELVVLPLVARFVQTVDTAVNASKSEGADFLIYGGGDLKRLNQEIGKVVKNVKIPIFASCVGKNMSYAEALSLLASGASGFVTSLEGFGLFDDDFFQKLFDGGFSNDERTLDDRGGKIDNIKLVNNSNGLQSKAEVVGGFIKLEDRKKQLIEMERSVLNEAIKVIKKAAPLMEEVSLLDDAVSQIDEPFLLVIVGEFNSDIEKQRSERHPDGQFICYLPAPILRNMTIVDTPGTNVILQRQQRLTEEFVPRADLLLFVISADRPLTGSEVAFLRYSQQWKKKVVFVLNKADIYQNNHELEEAMSFIKDNIKRLLNTEDVILYPVSARSALEAKLMATSSFGNLDEELSVSGSQYGASSFYELEKFLYSFLDGSTIPGMDRMRLKLETPVAIADRLFSACETLVTQDYRSAKQDLAAINDFVNSVNDFALDMESESLSWRRQTLSMIESSKSRVVELVEATMQLSNLDIIASYVFKGEKQAIPATSRIQNDIIDPSVSSVQKILGEYKSWLCSKNTQQGRSYKESFEKRWSSLIHENSQMSVETYELLKKGDEAGYKVIENFSSSAASKSFEQEVRDTILGTFGQLGVAGFSASLLTSVLHTTLEDLLALGICSVGGYLAISNFPTRRQSVIDKVKRKADTLAYELEEAMKKDLTEAVENLDTFVRVIGKPYQDQAHNRLNKLVEIQEEISNIDKKLRTLQMEIQNLHVS